MPTIHIKVEDVNTLMDTYESIQIHSATTVDGSYSLVTTLTLVEDDFYYEYDDTAGGESSWYKYRFYHSTGPVASEYSNPVQPNKRTRMALRQFAIEEYDAGMVLEQSATAGSTTQVYTDDYRVRNNRSAGSAKNSFIYGVEGLNAGLTRNVSNNTPSSGLFTVTPALAAAYATGDQFEWHWMVDTNTWNRCINRGIRRFRYLERVPIIGDGEREHPLDYLPWLTSRSQICSLWWYPSPTGPERAWSTDGRWWSARQENGYVTLLTMPLLQTSDTLYLECLRQVGELHTDSSLLPREAPFELIAALAYDEVLAWLLRPSSSAAESDKSVYKVQRNEHQSKLRNLWQVYGPRPRYQAPSLLQPATLLQPWSAR